MKIMIISHTFANPPFVQRWIDLAKMFPDLELKIESPMAWTYGNGKDLTFGKGVHRKGFIQKGDNYSIELIDMNNIKGVGLGWYSKRLVHNIKKFQPDIVYHIGTHYQLSLMECIYAVKRYSKRTKVVCFSMRGPQHTLQNLLINNFGVKKVIKGFFLKLFAYYTKKNLSAIICHYPEALTLFRNEGYKCPIYLSTQVGVRTDIFFRRPNEAKIIRDKYKIGDSFLFGSVSRFNLNKGIETILEALPKEKNCKYMIVGSGLDSEINFVKKKIDELKLTEMVFVVGFKDWNVLPDYLSSFDCLVHVPYTTKEWVETFSLAICQGMAVGLPVIGSDSGSVPYQIGRKDMIVKEHNSVELKNKMIELIDNPEQTKKIGVEMKTRCLKYFDTNVLNRNIKKIFNDICEGTYTKEYIDFVD